MTSRVEISSRLHAPAGRVWARVVTPEGVNHELGPWLRMTIPPRLRGATVDSVPLGETVGRSWVLLGGIVPVDYDDLCLVEVEPGRRFLERSRTLSMRVWQHERTVEPSVPGCTVSDTLTFELRAPAARMPGSARLAQAIVGAIFRHRHRRLASQFGA